jgi:hypothetical protein
VTGVELAAVAYPEMGSIMNDQLPAYFCLVYWFFQQVFFGALGQPPNSRFFEEQRG